MTEKEEFTDNPEQDEELFEHHRIMADPGQKLIRIDKFLMDRLPNVSRTKIQTALQEGFVKVNERQVKPSYKVHPSDVITVSLPQPPRLNEVIPENIPLHIIYEDEHLLVVNKPAGMVVHPAYQNWSGTLVNALAFHFKQLPQLPGNDGRPGLVHRIDKDTSGLLVIAKSEETLTGLARQFFNHTIHRSYWAIVWGVPEPPQGTIHVNVGRSLKDRRITVTFPDGDMGRNAITHYRLLKDLRYIALVECILETGRTHQIRAHMKHLGHPLFNDNMYGGSEILRGTVFSKYRQFVENSFKIMPRQALHAKTLGFEHPVSKRYMSFESAIPQDFIELLDKWESYVKYN